jgi:hypothetical protein
MIEESDIIIFLFNKVPTLKLFLMLALLKLRIDFGTLLIGAEGVRLLRECESKGDPTGAKHRGGSLTARGKRTPAVEINNQV